LLPEIDSSWESRFVEDSLFVVSVSETGRRLVLLSCDTRLNRAGACESHARLSDPGGEASGAVGRDQRTTLSYMITLQAMTLVCTGTGARFETS
jgi:hypothetical protein